MESTVSAEFLTKPIPTKPKYEVNSTTFLPESIKDVFKFKNRTVNIGWQTASSLMGLGYLTMNITNNPDIKVVGFMTAFLGFTGLPVTLSEIYKQIISNPIIKDPYPDIFGPLSKDKCWSIIKDGVRGFYSAEKNDRDISGVYSVLNYKKRLIDLYLEKVDSENGPKNLVGLMLETPDLELKSAIIRTLEKKGKIKLQDQALTMSRDENLSELERSASSYLAIKWNVPNSKTDVEELKLKAEKLKSLDIKNVFGKADLISKKVIEKFSDKLPNTLIPYVRLFVLRNVIGEYQNNKLGIEIDTFSDRLHSIINQRLLKFNILNREKSINYGNTTVGLEMQPDYKDTTVMKTNLKDIERIRSYAGFRGSLDEPFEFVLPPTRTPDAQLLILQEILMLTGIPIDRAGIQINFGGIENKKTVKTLQRIILSAGRMNPDWNSIKKKGDYWNLLNRNKGEVNVRKPADQEVEIIVPDSKNESGLNTVGELRASVGSENFFIFARGLIEARRIADHAKAYEQIQRGKSVSGIELEMTKKFELLITKYNNYFKEIDLPPINEEWKKKDWKKFGEIMTIDKMSNVFKGFLKEYLQ